MTTTRGQHLIGTEIGSCILETLIGYGGSSAVFRARSLTSQDQVAVKVFLPRATMDRQTRRSVYRRFLREAEATSQLNHPSILPIYAYGEHEGLPYIVMPYMTGGTLAAYVQRRGPLSLLEAARYLEQIGSALDYAHSQGCVHCDVKPANILLDSTGRAMLSDFGIVRTVQMEQAEGAASSAGAYAQQGEETLMGTPDYVSPEQALGEQLDGRSDIYSLGATLYYLLTGGPPFQADSPLTLALLHVHEMPTPPGVLRADITPQLDLVLAQALAKERDERFQSAGAFSQAFAQAVKETGIAAVVTPKVTQVDTPKTGSKTTWMTSLRLPRVRIIALQQQGKLWRAGVIVGLCVLLALGGVFSSLMLGFARGAPPPPQKHATPASPVLTDALLGAQQDWPISHTFFFQDGRYHIQNKTADHLVAAFFANHQFANLRLSLLTTEIAGSQNSSDYYGVIVRASSDQARYYLFEVTTWHGGQYGFLRSDGNGHWVMLESGPVPGFQTHSSQSNLLSINAQGHTFTFAVNGQQVGQSVHDSSGAAPVAGGIGLVVEEPGTEVAFTHLSIVELL